MRNADVGDRSDTDAILGAALTAQELDALVRDIARRMAAETDRGQVAQYIPELAKVDPQSFAIAVVLADGQTIVAGDADVPFSIQSISKVFTLTLALERVGDALWQRVGREPSGDPFNSIVQLEHDDGIPRNPLINAGALVVTDVLLTDRTASDVINDIVQFLRTLCGDDDVQVDEDVARSEARTGYRNAALANFMRAAGNLQHPPEHTLDVYFNHCAVAMSARQLALAGRFLAFSGCVGPGGSRVVPRARARRVNALMLTCGHYDGSGEFAFRVGLPGKSGVGGGILAVVPGTASIAVWSPGLNRVGNSQLAALALHELTAGTGWSIF